MNITQSFNNFSFTGETGVVYRGYFNTREGKELVAIKSCKRKFYILLSGTAQNCSASDNYGNNLARMVGQIYKTADIKAAYHCQR